MAEKDILKIIDYLISECNRLKNKYTEEKNLEADYVCIFARDESEYLKLIKGAEFFGRIAEETPTGPVFTFNQPLKTIAGNPKVLKIRKPDRSRPQRGDVDFKTNYQSFKRKYFDNKHFKLIEREKFEMIELKDKNFNVLVYFSNIPPSKLLGIKQ